MGLSRRKFTQEFNLEAVRRMRQGEPVADSPPVPARAPHLLGHYAAEPPAQAHPVSARGNPAPPAGFPLGHDLRLNQREEHSTSGQIMC
jgi:hypothetical protein